MLNVPAGVAIPLTAANESGPDERKIHTVLPADVELFTSPSPDGNFDIVLQFVHNKAEVEQDTPIAIELVKPGGRLWL